MGMNCNDFRQAHPAGGDDAKSHLASCADCRAFAASWELLGHYPSIEASRGFVRGIRRKLAPVILRFAAPFAAAAAALLIAILLTHHPDVPKTTGPVATEEERELVENLDLLRNYDLLKTLELVGENSSPLIEEKK